jgi:hypothetical protein
MNFTLSPKARHAMLTRFKLVCVIAWVMGLIFIALKLLPIDWISALFYSGCVTFWIWLLIEISENCFFYQEQRQFVFTLKRALSLIFATVLGHTIGASFGDDYSGYNTFHLAVEDPFRYFGLVMLVALVAFSTSFVFIYRRTSVTSKHLMIESNFKLLLSQLKPHTLLNTMANLRALIELDPPKSIVMLDTLNNYLRATVLASQIKWHPLSHELDRLLAYLALMEIRMGLRLYYTCDCPEDLAHFLIPPFLLQPVIDNAIKKGIEPSVEGGAIHIQARHIGEFILLTVSYTVSGGLTTEQLKSDYSLAFKEVRDRLHNTYGGRAKLSFTIKDSSTSTLQINLPVRSIQ